MAVIPKAAPPAGPAPAPEVRLIEQQNGMLTLNTKPWTTVYIDGKPKGVTPIYQLELPIGKHELRLENTAAGIDKKVMITVKSGEELVKNLKLQ